MAALEGVAQVGKLVDGDDGLPANEVGDWAKEKHECLRRYVDISRGVRAMWSAPGRAGATYIDPFCATGRARLKGTNVWIDGGAVAAWNESVKGSAAFTRVFIGDIDPVARAACAERLRRHGAPVVEIEGPARQMIESLVPTLSDYALHFAFLDPYSLEALDFAIMRSLAARRRMDILVHISKMDLQRNLGTNLSEKSAFDLFAPGWREAVDVNQSHQPLRQAVFDYWRDRVASLGTDPGHDAKLIRGPGHQPLYWLLIAAKHELAQKFWRVASNIDGQGSLEL